MRKTINAFKRWVDCYRYMLAVGGIVFGSMLFAFGASAWYYGDIITTMHEYSAAAELRYRQDLGLVRTTYSNQLARMQDNLEAERGTNRVILHQIHTELQALNDNIAKLSGPTVQESTVQAFSQKVETLSSTVRWAHQDIKQRVCAP